MSNTIKFRLVTGSGERTVARKTMAAAKRQAVKALGRRARLDPDGYAVGRNGNCLFFLDGCTFNDFWEST